jgi:hypothetical protein
LSHAASILLMCWSLTSGTATGVSQVEKENKSQHRDGQYGETYCCCTAISARRTPGEGLNIDVMKRSA